MNTKEYLYESYALYKKFKVLSDSFIDKIVTLQFPDFNTIDWETSYKDKDSHTYEGGCLMHGTFVNNLESILITGLKKFPHKNGYSESNYIWATNPIDSESITYGNSSVIFTIPNSNHTFQVNKEEYITYEDIPVENIVSVDFPLGEDFNISEIPSLVNDEFAGDVTKAKDWIKREDKAEYLTDKHVDKIFDWYTKHINKSKKELEEKIESAPKIRFKEWMTVEGLRDRDATSDFTTDKRQIRQMYYGGENRNARLTNCFYNPGKDTLTFEFKTIPTYKDHEPDYKPKITDPFDDFKLKPIVNDRYTMYIQVIDFMQWLGTRPASAGDITRGELKDVFEVAYVKVFCNCPSFHWQAANFNASQLDASIYPTNIPPKKWGKVHGEYSCLCKHLSALLKQFYFFEQQMAAKTSKCLRLAGYIK